MCLMIGRAYNIPTIALRFFNVYGPCAHPAYNQQTFTLNLTRQYGAPVIHQVRPFEAAACGCPIISDWWEGLDGFFKVGDEILIADSPNKTLEYLFELSAQER